MFTCEAISNPSSGLWALTSCVVLDLRGLRWGSDLGLRWVSDLGLRWVISDLVVLEAEPDLMLMVGSSRCLVVGERSVLDSPAAWGVAPNRSAAATSRRRREKRRRREERKREEERRRRRRREKRRRREEEEREEEEERGEGERGGGERRRGEERRGGEEGKKEHAVQKRQRRG